MKWVLLILGIVTNSAASVLVKVAVTPPRKFPTLQDPLALFTNWPLVVGLFCYGLAFLLYGASLERLPLNVAQPILTAGAIMMVTLSSVVFFQESVSIALIIGILLIVAGVVVIGAQVK